MSEERALSFGSVADDYEATRPGWPLEPFVQVLGHFGAPAEPAVVDLAAGTGKLTRTLTRLPGRLVAVEPDAALRAVLERVVPGVEVLPGTAEALPLPDASADVVCVGQAFHWFDLVAAPREIRRVLRPGGILMAGWNAPPEDGTWYDAVIDFLRVANPDHLPASNLDWPDTLAAFDGFERLYTVEYRHEQPSDYASFARLLGTHSIISVQPEPRRAAIIEEARAVAVEQGAFRADGTCAIPWSCSLYALVRRPG